MPDRALVLTAGIGTRLRPLSYVRAKPAVPVAGVPLIHRVLRWLSRQGVHDVVLNLHYRPETIAAVVGDGGDLGVRVRYAWEPTILGSAGGPRAALSLLGPGRFFIVNGDTLTDVDLAALAEAHVQAGARVTLAVAVAHPGRRYGGVVANADGWVRGFTGAGNPTPAHHFVGVQLVEPDVFRGLPVGQAAASIGGVYSALAATAPRAIRVARSAAHALDVGTPAEYLATSLSVAAAEGFDVLPYGRRTEVDPTARLSRTAVWDDVRIGARSELTDCVVADGVHLPADSRFRAAAIVHGSGRPTGPGERRVGDLLVATLAGQGRSVPSTDAGS